MLLREREERGPVDLIGSSDRDPARGLRFEGRGADATFEHGALAEDRAGADLGDRLAVDEHREHTVEEEEEVVARLALLARAACPS